jgi:hypothetical protein
MGLQNSTVILCSSLKVKKKTRLQRGAVVDENRQQGTKPVNPSPLSKCSYVQDLYKEEIGAIWGKVQRQIPVAYRSLARAKYDAAIAAASEIVSAEVISKPLLCSPQQPRYPLHLYSDMWRENKVSGPRAAAMIMHAVEEDGKSPEEALLLIEQFCTWAKSRRRHFNMDPILALEKELRAELEAPARDNLSLSL